MKGIFVRFTLLLLLVTVFTAGNHVYSQRPDRDRDRREQRLKHHKPPHWPAQVITQRDLSISPARVVNFQQLADSQAAHPIPSRTGFIGQIEDKDADFKFIPHVIPAGTPVFDPDTFGANGGSHRANRAQHQRNSPAPLGYFLGTTGNGSLIPPDVAGAVGPTYVFEVNNQQFDIYTKTGTLHATLSIDNFFSAGGGVTGGYFDPHICYDANYGKFIVVIDGNLASNNDGALFVAVSQTSDPNGSWWVYAIDDGDANANDLLDYPQLGYNKNWVVITANDFLTNTTPQDIYVLNRASLYSGTLGTVRLFTDNNAFSWGPAETHDTTTNTLWMVQDGNGASGAMQIGSITGTAANPAYNAGSNISVTSTWNETAVDAGQKGGGTSQLINSDDTRIGNGCVFVNGKLWFTHAVWLPATGTATYAASDWWQITPSTLTVNQFGRIADPNGNTNYYYPTINVNANNDALLGYCVSGTDSFYGSAAYSFRAGTDAVNTMQSRYIYKAGLATYYQTLGGARNRYGDYTGTVVDPVDNSFWNFSEYANSSTIWGTVIAHVAAAVIATNPPVASFSASPTLNTCSGPVQFTDLSTNIPTSWLWNFGDGTTSNQQNPTHTYTSNGTYTVSLQATNAYGSNTQTQTSYITVSLPAGPTAANVSHCGSSSFSLSASTTSHVAWFDTTGTQVSGANPFVTPTLTRTATYFVQDTVAAAIDSVGPPTYTTLGAGGVFTGTNQHYMTFDALSNFTLVSVLVDASTAGTRTIQLINSGGTVIATATPNIPIGVSTVALNFSVPAGTGYELSISGTVNLYRNNAVATSPYPYTIPGVVSITGNDVGTGYYYYFYNWKVQGPGCVSARTPVTATIYPGGLTATPTPTAVACNGGLTGGVSLATSGGTSSYTYHWSNNQTGSSITGVAAGTYTVTITDAHSCTASATSTVSQPSALAVTATVTNVACLNSTTGSIAASGSGGTLGYQYSWSTTPRQTTATATALAAGSYTVTVTDAHSCTTSASYTVSQPTTGITLSTSSVNASCGSSNGTATVNVLTGPGSYTYSWSGSGGTAATATGLAAGNYTVTVSSAGGCNATASAVVSSTGGPTLAPTSANTTCGNNNGSARVIVTSGSGPYTYAWSNSATDSAISSLAAGSYTVTVRDVNGCASISTVTVTPSNGLSLTPTSTATTCGNNNGSATITVGSPGSPVYSWSNSGSTATISGVASGVYTVTVTDNGCSSTASVSVAPSTGVSLQTSSVSTSCGAGNNGSATVTVSNPSGPTYLWSNSGTTATISNIGAGTYTVTVTNGGCTGTASVTVSPGSGTLSVTPSSTADQCFGGATGTAAVNVTGGTPNYSYHWSNSQTTNSITGLAAGSYIVTITDGGGCVNTTTVTITQPTQISISGTPTSTSCIGLADGSAVLTVSGGTPNYTYLWSNGQTAATLSNVTSGSYGVTVYDGNGCTATSNVAVAQPSPVNATISVTNPTTTVHTGSATITNVTGGTNPYTESWSNGQTGTSVSGLLPGTYTVTVTDAHGCIQTDTVVIDKTNGISNIDGGISFTIYPNPARTEVVVDLQDITAEATISLKDILGQTLVNRTSSVPQTTIDLSPFITGVYFIEVTQGGKKAVRRLIISK